MDDIMKSLTLSTMEDDEQNTTATAPTTSSSLFDTADKSPLLEDGERNGDDEFLSSEHTLTASHFQNGNSGRSSFDNLGLDTDSQERTDIEDGDDDRRSGSVRDSIASSSEGGGVMGGVSGSDSKASISDDPGSGRDEDGGLAARRKPKLRIVSWNFVFVLSDIEENLQ